MSELELAWPMPGKTANVWAGPQRQPCTRPRSGDYIALASPKRRSPAGSASDALPFAESWAIPPKNRSTHLLYAGSPKAHKALVEYVEAFGYKVDRIANYIKAQKAEAETAGREVERLESRRKAAENREKRLKSMLVYYMVTRELRQLRGALNTITLQGNSQPSLVVNDASHMPNVFYRARVDLPWTEWEGILASLPPGALLERLRAAEGRFVQKELQRGVLADAMARGEAVEGAALVKGQHVRVR